jgi:type IX secretion system PorP/SprF family membrane protein
MPKIKVILSFRLFIGIGMVLGIGLYQHTQAQDTHFSQFFASPLYVNPAFTGTTPQGRFTFNYRTQWPNLPGEFVTYQVGYDQSFDKSRSSLGAYAILDKAGSAGVRSTHINVIYAYTLPLGQDIALKSGFQMGYGSRTLDYYKLVFGDQLTETGLTKSFSEENGLENLNINYLDASAGFLLYGEKFWMGVSGQHLNRPNQSITEIPEKLSMKLSFHAGYKLVKYGHGRNKRDGYSMALNPAIFYSRQGNYQQLDIGANGFIDPLILGFWYRDVPIQKTYNGAVVLMTGVFYNGFQFLYNYDIPVGRFAGITGGAHEISLYIQVGDLQTRQKYRRKGKMPFFPDLIH